MAFNVNRFASSLLTTVVDGSVNTSKTDIKLLGKGVVNYGEIIAENLVWMVENFAGATAPTKPIIGQLWYDSANLELKICVEEDPDVFEKIALTSDEVLGGGILPTQPRPAGELFWNAGVGLDNRGLEFVSDGTDWLSFAPLWQSSEPEVDNLYNFGTASKRWKTIYAVDFIGTTSSAKYSDLAERYAASENLEAGDLVRIGGEAEITKTLFSMDVEVYGVISTAPGFKMNENAGFEEEIAEEDLDKTHPYVALSGRVPVKVQGTVAKGQRLVSSVTPGIARAVTVPEAQQNLLAVFGRALEAKTSVEVGLIEAVIGVK